MKKAYHLVEKAPLLCEKEKDPHRNLSVWGAAFTLVAGAVGAGMLALPSVLGKDGKPRAGWAGGFALLSVAVCFQRVANNCISKAIDLSGRGHKSFEALALDVLGVWGQILASIMANVTALGFATCYLIVLGEMIARLAVAFIITSGHIAGYSLEVLSIGIVTLVLLPFVFIPLNEKLGMVAVFAVCLILPLIGKAAAAAPGGATWTLVGPMEQLGPAFCTIVFALGFGFLVPAVKGRMVEPCRMVEASDIALVMCVSIYTAVMGVCYYAWGDDNKSNVLQQMGGHMAIISNGFLLIHLVIAYGIMTQTAFGGISDSLSLVGTKAHLVRFVIGVSCGLVAMSVPCFGEFIDLVSALTLVGCNYLLPFACYWLLGSRQQASKAAAVREDPATAFVHIIVVVGGILAMVLGVWFGFANLVAAMDARAK